MWAVEDVSFELVDEMTDDPIVTLLVLTPAGRLTVTAEPIVQGTSLRLQGTHVQDTRANTIGAGNLLVIAQALMERMGFDGLIVEGAIRTTGANPGHRPRILRFARRVRAASLTGSRIP